MRTLPLRGHFELEDLRARLALVERRATPEYVVCRRTNKLRIILTLLADAGAKAVAFCGHEFAAPGSLVRFESVLPEGLKWEDACSTCLPKLEHARGASRAPSSGNELARTLGEELGGCIVGGLVHTCAL